jgi:predicted nucleic acid-binding protein
MDGGGNPVAILARLQNYSATDRRRIMNDALLFATAGRHGLTVLTRSVADFDLLQQLEPSVNIPFYDRQ